MQGDRSLDQSCFYRRHSNEEKRSSGQTLQSLPLQEIREDHSDEDERPDDTLSLDSPGKSFKKQSSGLSAQRSGLSQQRSGLGQQRSGLGMQKSGLSDKEGENADSKVAEKPPRPSFWRLLALNKPEWPYLLLGTIGAIAAGLVNPFWALIVSQVSDSCRLLIGLIVFCVFVLRLPSTSWGGRTSLWERLV
jgi:ATP-binding cassette subfamily B (MDR/TAP) protein 1